MPAQSRAQRRRANSRTQEAVHTPRLQVPDLETPVAHIQPVALVEPDLTAHSTLAPAPNSRSVRRLKNRAAPEPIDYTKDYKYAVSDLRLIALWSILLFAAMIGLYFARINGFF